MDIDNMLDGLADDHSLPENDPEVELLTDIKESRKKPRQMPWSKFSEGLTMDPPIPSQGLSPERLLAVYQNVRCEGCGQAQASLFLGLFVGRTHFYQKANAEHLTAYVPAKHKDSDLERDFVFLEGEKLIPVCFGCMPQWRARRGTTS